MYVKTLFWKQQKLRNYPWESDMALFNAGCDFSRKSRDDLLKQIQAAVSLWPICILFQDFVYNYFSQRLSGVSGEWCTQANCRDWRRYLQCGMLQKPLVPDSSFKHALRVPTSDATRRRLGNCIFPVITSLSSECWWKRGSTPLLSHVFLIRVGIQDESREEDDVCWVTSLYLALGWCLTSVCPS